MCNQILVLNRVGAEEFDCASPWGCISVADTEEDFADISEENRVALLQLAFLDVTQSTPGYALFHDNHAHDILDFVTHYWDKIDVLLIHCEAGISRSSAIAAAISRLKFGDESEFVDDPFDPNPLVYRILREVATGRADYEKNWQHEDE